MYKDILFNDFDNLSDKLIQLNKNDIFIKEYADRITHGYYAAEDTSFITDVGTTDSIVINSHSFWVPHPNRMIEIIFTGGAYSLYPGLNNIIITIELDSTQVFQKYTSPVYNGGAGIVTIDPWSDTSAICDVDAGEHDVTIKVKKVNSSPQVNIQQGTLFVVDIGSQRDEYS